MREFIANKGNDLVIEVDGIDYLRIPIKTKVIGPNDQLEKILDQCARSILSNDLLLGILKDNPLGQSNEQTPLGIIRKKEVPCEKI